MVVLNFGTAIDSRVEMWYNDGAFLLWRRAYGEMV